MYDLDPHLLHDSLGLTRVCSPNDISIGSAVFSQYTRVPNAQTDRQTHRHADNATSEICNNRSFHCTAFRRCGLQILTIAEKLRHTPHIRKLIFFLQIKQSINVAEFHAVTAAVVVSGIGLCDKKDKKQTYEQAYGNTLPNCDN